MTDKIEEKLDIIVKRLYGKFGRAPTEEEVQSFINGTMEERLAIWNKEAQ